MGTNSRILLILDIDETLIFASERDLERSPDFRVGPYSVYRRPHLDEFLKSCCENFEIAIWSSSGADYLAEVLRRILPAEVSPVFVWDRERCVRAFDSEQQETCFVKDLKKIKRLGYDLDRVLIVDDTPQKAQRNYGNAIYVSPFCGDAQDDELLDLSRYLESLCHSRNVQTIEKRGWKRRL
jgi:RNA polymerase II subunit A small phosphatase-like protein